MFPWSSVTFVTIQILHVYFKVSSGALAESKGENFLCGLDDKCACVEGPGDGCLQAQPWLPTAAMMKPEDSTATANNTPSFACRCPSCGPGRLSNERDIGIAHSQNPPRLASLWALASPSCSPASTAQEDGIVPWKRFSHCAIQSWELCARTTGPCMVHLVQTSMFSLLCRSPTLGG